MFDLDQLVVDCRAALGDPSPRGALREVLQRAVSQPALLLEALPADEQSMVAVHVADDLTILHLVNAPGFVYLPHDHVSWSACAFVTGRERNTFYRRTPGGLEQSGGKEYGAGDVVMMGADVIHSIENPLRKNNAALHVFAANAFAGATSQWDVVTLEEAPYDVAYAMEMYPTPA